MVKARCLRVPKQRAELARRRLADAGLLVRELQPDRDGEFVYLPVKDGKYDGEAEICVHEFTAVTRSPASYRDIARVPVAVKDGLPRAYDVIGKVIVIKIPEEMAQYRTEIGRALLIARPQARSVAEDRGVQGDQRIRKLEVIAGEPDLETVHIEHGLKFWLDPSKVYFSPRLATERLRVEKLVCKGETVLDMFAGVGPFSIHVARKSGPSRVYAADINPVAIEYLKQNIRLNRAANVEPMLIDAHELPGKLPPVDRIIMNLPHSAFGFLDAALKLLQPGGTIHLYDVIARKKRQSRKDEVERAVKDAGRKLSRSNLRMVRGYSAAESHFVFDLSVE